MSALSQARADLGATLEDTGYDVETTVPEQVDGPVLIVQAAPDYLAPDSGDTTYDPTEWPVSLEVHLVPADGSNASVIDDLDAMVCAVVPALVGDGWAIERVTNPQVIAANDWTAYAVVVTVSTLVNLTAQEESTTP